jgi:hypothetical protein
MEKGDNKAELKAFEQERIRREPQLPNGRP